jgi:hypothetical protein
MNCQEIELQLSGYLEKSLDSIRMKSIETHLSTCPFCRAELHTLSDCIRIVADLPKVEPPSGFSQRIMACAREIDLEPRSWQRFLAAFKLTVPVQAAAVVLVSVLAVVLYQKEPQLKDIAFTESSRATPPLEVQEKTTDNRLESVPVTPLQNDSLSRSAKRDIQTARETPSAQPANQARQAAASRLMKDEAVTPQSPPSVESEKATEKASENRIVAPRRATIQAQEVSTGSDSLRPSADALGSGAAVGALSRSPFRAPPFSAGKALSPLSEPNPDFEFVVKRRSSERHDQNQASSNELRKRSEATVGATSAGERSVGAPGTPASQIVEIRWFTVAQQHYDQFRKELAAEALIDSEKSIAAKENDFGLKTQRDLLIKVTILPSER